jgi:hypothetical protein
MDDGGVLRVMGQRDTAKERHGDTGGMSTHVCGGGRGVMLRKRVVCGGGGWGMGGPFYEQRNQSRGGRCPPGPAHQCGMSAALRGSGNRFYNSPSLAFI